MLQFDIQQIAVCHSLPKVIHSWSSEVCSAKPLGSQSGHNKGMDRPTVKILTVVIRYTTDVLNVASTGLYTILALIVHFKWCAC